MSCFKLRFDKFAMGAEIFFAVSEILFPASFFGQASFYQFREVTVNKNWFSVTPGYLFNQFYQSETYILKFIDEIYTAKAG